MKKNNSKAWNTKYGVRRVRDEAPTLEEAIVAAQGLSDDIDEQTDIASALMGLPQDEVRTALKKLPPPPKEPLRTVTFAGPASAPRTVVVERKPTRRIAGPSAVALVRQRLSAGQGSW